MSPGLVVSCLWYSETPTVEMRRAWHREPQWLRTHHIFVTALELHPEQSEAMTLRALESDLLTF